MTGYPTARLGQVCRVVPGFAFKSRDWCSDGIPVVKIKNIREDSSVEMSDCDHVPASLLTRKIEKFVLRDGDIVLAMTGATAGKAGRIRSVRDFLLNQRVARLVPQEAEPNFFWSVVSSEEYRSIFFRLADGAAQPNMSGGQIESVEIPNPPLPTQRRIASILSAYDDLIENNTKRIEILEEMARSLYREWFVHFRFPGHEKVKLVDSELGKIPEGWEVDRLDAAFVMQRGFDLPKKKRVEGDVPIFASTGVTGFHDESKAHGPAVVTGRSGTIGDVQLVDGPYWPLNTALWSKEFRKASASLAYFVLKEMDFSGLRGGAAVPTLNRNHLHARLLVLPPSSLVATFDEAARPMFALKRTLERKNSTLRQTRDLLLPKLISGEIDVDALDLPEAS